MPQQPHDRPDDPQVPRPITTAGGPDARVWDRWDGESEAAFAGFRAYLDLGSGRSVVKAAKQAGQAGPSVFYKHSRRFHWDDRAAQWDAWMARTREQGIAAAVFRSSFEWVQVRHEWMIESVAVARLMRDRARRLIEYAKFEQSLHRDERRGEASPVRADLVSDDRQALLDRVDGEGDLKRARALAGILRDASATIKEADAIAWPAIEAGVDDWIGEKGNAEAGTGDGDDSLTTNPATTDDLDSTTD